MATASLATVVGYCERLLRPGDFRDYENAENGLQVENRGTVSRLAAAVDASHATVKLAIAARADFLVVHHGLFWSRRHPWTGRHYQLLRLLLDNNLAVYSSHLPLDAHPRVGNNARLLAALGWKKGEPFFLENDRYVGLRVETEISRTHLQRRLEEVLGSAPAVLPGGPTMCRRIGIVTGGGGGHLPVVASEGVDTFITGEGPHWTYAQAEELGLNVFYGGHYATETFGVKALAECLAKRFKLPWEFLNHPTGL